MSCDHLRARRRAQSTQKGHVLGHGRANPTSILPAQPRIAPRCFADDIATRRPTEHKRWPDSTQWDLDNPIRQSSGCDPVQINTRSSMTGGSSSPGQVMLFHWQASDALPCDAEHGVDDSWRDLRHRFFTHAFQPVIGLEEADVHLAWILAHARDREVMEVVLLHSSFLHRELLMHDVVPSPRNLSLDLLSYRQRIDEAKALIEGHVYAFQTDGTSLADRHGA